MTTEHPTNPFTFLWDYCSHQHNLTLTESELVDLAHAAWPGLVSDAGYHMEQSAERIRELEVERDALKAELADRDNRLRLFDKSWATLKVERDALQADKEAWMAATSKAVTERDAARAEVERLTEMVRAVRNEVSCRIDHGYSGFGHLEYVQSKLNDALDPMINPVCAKSAQPPTEQCGYKFGGNCVCIPQRGHEGAHYQGQMPTKPSTEPDPGEGWRWLAIGEIFQRGDVWRCPGSEVKPEFVGQQVRCEHNVRRRIAPEAANLVAGPAITLAEAQRRGVCRICQEPYSAGPGSPFILNFGDEFAHKKCLDAEQRRSAPEAAKEPVQHVPIDQKPRKIVAISSAAVANTPSTQCNMISIALCDDGTLWRMRDDLEWEGPLAEIPQESKPGDECRGLSGGWRLAMDLKKSKEGE